MKKIITVLLPMAMVALPALSSAADKAPPARPKQADAIDKALEKQQQQQLKDNAKAFERRSLAKPMRIHEAPVLKQGLQLVPSNKAAFVEGRVESVDDGAVRLSFPVAAVNKNMRGEVVTSPAGAPKRYFKWYRIAPNSTALTTAKRFIGQKVRLDLKGLRGGVAIVSNIAAAK